MKRWLARIGLGLLGLIVLVVVLGAGFEQYKRAQAAHRYPPMGKLVDIGGRRLQIDCRGTGSPTVVFEAGLDNLGSLAWAAVHDSIAATTRACAYSRAGILWSDPASGAFDVRRMARDLHAALSGAGERPPFIMVGHSLGGPYIMTFTSLYPGEVAGLIFVDASHPDQIDRFRRALGPAAVPDPSPTLFKALAALTWTGVARVLPLDPPGPPLTKAVSSAYVGTSLGPVLQEGLAIEASMAVAGQFRDLGDRPLVVLTGAKPYSADQLKSAHLTAAQGSTMGTTWKALHDDEATWSKRSRHQIVPDASHYIQFDRPDVVIAAVREVITATAAR